MQGRVVASGAPSATIRPETVATPGVRVALRGTAIPQRLAFVSSRSARFGPRRTVPAMDSTTRSATTIAFASTATWPSTGMSQTLRFDGRSHRRPGTRAAA